MMYSSAIFANEYTPLDEASDAKLERICQQLALTDSDHVIEIGTGWGGFAIYAASHYGCRVTTTTISDAQFQEAAKRIEQAGLGHLITLLKHDYRDLTGTYDKLVSIEMIEAVGHHYLDQYFSVCKKLLKPKGKAVIQAITIEDTRYAKALKTVDFIKRYIFPGSFIPSNAVIIEHAAQNGLKVVDLKDIGVSYAYTLKHWRLRFFERLAEVKALGFDERFIRMWEFYLCYCEGGFFEGIISDVQYTFDARMPSGSLS